MAVSLGLAGALYVLIIDMEQRLIAETLSVGLEDYMARFRLDPEAPPPVNTTLRTFVFPPGTGRVPAPLRRLDAGLHHVQLEDGAYYVEVRPDDGRRFVVLLDDRPIRQRENRFRFYLGVCILSMTLLSALLGFWLARRITSPLGVLAARVAGLRPRDSHSPLAGDFPRDEVGVLAREFDACLLRLAALVRRERAFTADVSHELRTPLAVIEGATGVLLDDPGMDEARRARVERIARAAHEVSELVTALLLLAREEKDAGSASRCDVGELLQQVVEGQRHFVRHKPVEIRLDVQAQTTLPVECALLRVVLNNLVCNAISNTGQGLVSIALDEQGISVTDTGVGIPGDRFQRIFERYYTGSTGGEGIGLSLVKRICRRYGWDIGIESHLGQGSTFRLTFRA
jgi:signal transduction histidine kinase